MTPDESGDEITFANDAKRFDTGEAGMRAYLCKNCGAELMADETTTAAECPYCGSPTILPDRIDVYKRQGMRHRKNQFFRQR